MSELSWVDELKVVELRKKLKELGENATGKKVVLVERLKAKLTEQQTEKKEEVAEPQGDEMQGVEEETMGSDEADEKKEAKGGLNELLGDGKDDLEFDFEAEKPTRKKQKVESAEPKGDQPFSGEKSAEETSPSAKAPEKKPADDDLVDFEAPQGEMKEAEVSTGQATGPSRTASGVETMPPEAPVIAEEDRTCSLRIQNFVRPFTEKAAKEMLSAFGTIVDMWMPPIKTHCFVLYETTEQAHDAYLGTYNVVWPRSGKHLIPQYVTVEDAKKAIEDGRSKALFARASGSASYQKNRQTSYPPNAHPTATAPPARTVSKPALELEDLFFKTQAKPPIYYLPLTDEQVAERKRSAQEKETPSENPTGNGSKDA